jgi:hypothetical protein
MKKLLPFFLLFSAGFVHADWTPIASSLNDPKLYIDHDSIKTTIPGRPQVYHIANYAQIQNINGKDFRSEMFRFEYDCEKSLFREIGHTWHKGEMATDMIVYFSEGAWAWTTPERGSKEEVLLMASCK